MRSRSTQLSPVLSEPSALGIVKCTNPMKADINLDMWRKTLGLISCRS